MKDELFKRPIKKQFEFDESVASVFDDMISRSVPYYEISSELICDIVAKRAINGAKVFDFGCSTGSLLLKLYQKRKDLCLVGVDNSDAMIKSAKNKALAFGADVKFILDDILNFSFANADVVLLNYTLQFIRPINRQSFIDKIYHSLNDNALFIFSEKLVFKDGVFTKEMIEIYESYKEKQGYSRYEIAQKREALENVLIPYTEDENKKLCQNAGFKAVETIFRWGNFSTFVAFKRLN